MAKEDTRSKRTTTREACEIEKVELESSENEETFEQIFYQLERNSTITNITDTVENPALLDGKSPSGKRSQ